MHMVDILPALVVDVLWMGARQKGVALAQAVGRGLAAGGLAEGAGRASHFGDSTTEVVLDSGSGFFEPYTRRVSMRFVTYQSDAGPRLGVVQDESVLPLPGLDMLRMIEAGPAGLDPVWKAGGGALKLAELSLLAPIPAPRRNIFGIGLNYMKHGQEGAAARGATFVPPDRPVLFTKT